MKQLFVFLTGMALLASCSNKIPHARYDIIPLPVQLIEKEGEFVLKNGLPLYVSSENEELRGVAEMFAGQIRTASGIRLDIQNLNAGDIPEKGIIFQSKNDSALGTEGYSLMVDKEQVLVLANTAKGFFYAVQTLFQLLPPEIYSTKKESANWTMACVEITDSPRLPYRGMHLDVCRYIFPVEFIKKYIDLMAIHKLNRFHWHLTDDQGWRIEIKQYPQLQETAAWRDGTWVGHYGDKTVGYDTIRYGGYYTQEEIKEVIAYAASRYIEVIPEIEMPGHATAALAAYSWLGCKKDTAYTVAGTWGVFDDVFCTTNEVFNFLENVLTEVMELFPSEYIHIGGDECPKARWKKCPHCQAMIKQYKLKDEHGLQSYFIQRIEKFVNAQGKKIIGWDEILEGGLAPNATVMSWRGEKGGIESAMQGHDVIMTPTSYLYFDYYQSDNKEAEPLAIGGFVSLEKVYSFNPVPEILPLDKQAYIIGVQANLWTEYIPDAAQAEYMAFPRASALSEIAWTSNNSKNFTAFLQRLQTQFKRFDYIGVNYAKHNKCNLTGL
ncbi:MAG: beta-N-acetylhexosaminidase [Prevotellaceae bacterium]|jgi:hexosaminidase|nr:beta-N-acetylhexosaminidase [Prevotellaceae bacterium]